MDEVGLAFLVIEDGLMRRDPADVQDQEYRDFYKGVSKDDTAETLGWAHFKVSPLILITLEGPSSTTRATPDLGCRIVQSCTSPLNCPRISGKRSLVDSIMFD
jgi:hypothetical protein